MKRLLLLLSIALTMPIISQAEIPGLETLPVQDGGRVKPFNSFARESLQLVYGRQSYKKKTASEIIVSWMLAPSEWDRIDFIEISDAGLKKALRYKDLKKMHFTPIELMQNDRVGLLITELNLKSQRGEKLNGFDQAVQRLNNQLSLYAAIKKGFAIQVEPRNEEGNTRWKSIMELEGVAKESFDGIIKAFAKYVIGAAEGKRDPDGVNQAVGSFIGNIKSVHGEYFDETRIKAEVWLHNFQPFLISSIIYFLAFLAMGIAWFSKSSLFYKSAWTLSIVAFLLHTVGFIVRVYITGRPPVANMYETVVWAPWGTMIFAYILELKYSKRVILLAANLVAALCLCLASLAPTILDPSLQPLEAVLRSTLWLIVHVMMIVLSYGAFFLAWAIGNMVLLAHLYDPAKFKEQIKDATMASYRSIQIGVVLLAAGTILGGVWADYSWGRFWGWDPKETWALIALLGYLAVLHARLSGWLKDFGLAAASVAAFSLVVMAWYGVNYWLGAGLHSYGFGAGGIGYVAIAVGIQLLFVVFVTGVRYLKPKP